MEIRGFQVVSEHDASSEEGFSTTVSDSKGAIRGPFAKIREAVLCAHAWAEENAKAALKAVEDAAPVVAIATASEAAAVQVPAPAENPPVLSTNVDKTNEEHT